MPSAKRSHRTDSPTPFGLLSHGGVPGRGLLYSALVHEIAIFAILLMPLEFRHERTLRYVEQWIPIESPLIYPLPAVGGGHEGGGREGGGGSQGNTGKIPGPGPASAPAEEASRLGRVYPGTQPMVSNPPNPNNEIQTLLQPDIPNAPTLKLPHVLPNWVAMARARQNATPPPLVPKLPQTPLKPEALPQAPALKRDQYTENALPYEMPPAPPLVPTVPEPKLEMPPPSPETLPAEAMNQVQPPNPDILQSAPTNLPPPPPQVLPAGGQDDHNLLALSPATAETRETTGLPAGEARARFAIGPEARNGGPGVGGGGGTDKMSASAGPGIGKNGTVGTGGTAGPGSGEGLGAGTGGGGRGTGPGGQGTGTGSGVGAGRGSGVGPGSGSGTGGSGKGGGGSGTGQGSGAGPGRGSGAGTGSGQGSGAGSGSGKGPFPGISITGGTITGSGDLKRPAANVKPPTPLRQNSYGLTIVSTASSGGGLGDYGVFRDQAVYTVYIDMRQTIEDPEPSWTLQYAVLQPPDQKAAGNNGVVLSPSEQVSPPYAIYKDLPHFPAEVIGRSAGQMAVVYGIISVEGKMENLRIMQTPDNRLGPPLLEALGKWRFRPAQVNGQDVAVKALFGIPITPSLQSQ